MLYKDLSWTVYQHLFSTQSLVWVACDNSLINEYVMCDDLAAAFGLGRNHGSSPQWCYIHCLRTVICRMCWYVVEIYVDGIFGGVFCVAVRSSADKERGWEEHGSADDCSSCLCHSCATTPSHPHCCHHTVRLPAIFVYIGWQWRNCFISYLCQLFYHHVVGQALRSVSYSDITFLVR